MGISARVAVGVTGLVFVGGAGLAAGATPAGAEALVAAPSQVISVHGCGDSRCSANRHTTRLTNRHTNRNSHRQSGRQRVIVVNRIHNVAKVDSGQMQRQREEQNRADQGRMNTSSATSAATSSGASSSAGGGSGAGGGGGGGGGGGNQALQSVDSEAPGIGAPRAPGAARTPGQG
ncbi:MAG TPA: hypothetical protein VGP70_23180 [Actinomadura sp.]|jgi:hypothetical protein|nr:hypothetical protein [Actinomadura sp.]